MSKKADVSVIIPCYRCCDTITRAVKSIAEQTMLPAEVILIDDCSGDETLTKLYQIQSAYPKGWIQVVALSENVGAGMARNAGWEVTSYRYIAFLDSDDSWHPQKIEIQYGWMEKHPGVSLTGHAWQQGTDGKLLHGLVDYSINNAEFSEVSKSKLLLKNYFSTPSVMLRRDIALRFSMGKRYSEDYQLWMKICFADLKCHFSFLPLAYLYKRAYGEAGLSSALWKMEKGELAVYVSLFNSKKIKVITLIFLLGFSITKFLRRVVVSKRAK